MRKQVFFKIKIQKDVLFLSFGPDETISQEFAIYFTFQSQRQKIYSDLLPPGDDLLLEIELDHGGEAEVYFSNNLILKERVLDTYNNE